MVIRCNYLYFDDFMLLNFLNVRLAGKDILFISIAILAIPVITMTSQIYAQPSSEQNTAKLNNKPPIAVITSSSPVVNVGEPINFSAYRSSDPDGKIISYKWDFEDNTNGTGRTVTHVYHHESKYSVLLTITDDDGDIDTATHDVTVQSGWTALEEAPMSTLITVGTWAVPSGGLGTLMSRIINKDRRNKGDENTANQEDLETLKSNLESLKRKTSPRQGLYVIIAGVGCLVIGIAFYFILQYLGIKINASIYLITGIAAAVIAVALVVWLGHIWGERSIKRVNKPAILALEKQIQKVESNQEAKQEQSNAKQISYLNNKIEDLKSTIDRLSSAMPQYKLFNVKDTDELQKRTNKEIKEILNDIGVKGELEPTKKIQPNSQVEDLIAAANKLDSLREELLQKQTTLNREDAILLANYYFYTGKFQQALQIYGRIISQFPDDVDALVNNGRVLYRLGKLRDALPYLDRTLEFKKNDAYALAYEGLALWRLNEKDKAVIYYEKFLEIQIDESNIDTLVNKATIFERLNKNDKAVIYYEKALTIKIDENDVDALVNMGIAYDGLGKLVRSMNRHSDAVLNYKKVLNIDEKNVFALFQIACSYSLQGKFDDALKFLEKCVNLYPDYKDMAKSESDFDRLRQDEKFNERFEKLVN
jgi:tetratricopeptide (TPR) repeat protein